MGGTEAGPERTPALRAQERFPAHQVQRSDERLTTPTTATTTTSSRPGAPAGTSSGSAAPQRGRPLLGVLVVVALIVVAGLIAAPGESGDSGALQDAGRGTAVGLWLSRVADYLGLTALVGFLIAGGVLMGDGPRLSPSARRAGLWAGAAAAAWAAAALALFAFGLSSASARPLPAALALENATRFAGTRFGLALLIQGVAAAAVALVAVAARTRTALLAALAVVALAVLTVPWRGHAGSDDPAALAIAVDWAHVLSATAWAGGLVALLLLLLGKVQRGELLPATGRFSRLAGAALVVVAISGAGNALLHMGAVNQLWTTSWGRAVLVKLALFGCIGLLGYVNRSRMLPALHDEGSQGERGDNRPGAAGGFRQIVLVEGGLMLAAFATAATLTSGIPADAEVAARIQSIFASFGDGQINLTVDPAETGSNVVHLYVLDAAGLQRPAEQPRLVLTPEAAASPIDVPLLPGGPGHYLAYGLALPRSGLYQVELSALVGGRPTSTTAEITVR